MTVAFIVLMVTYDSMPRECLWEKNYLLRNFLSTITQVKGRVFVDRAQLAKVLNKTISLPRFNFFLILTILLKHLLSQNSILSSLPTSPYLQVMAGLLDPKKGTYNPNSKFQQPVPSPIMWLYFGCSATGSDLAAVRSVPEWWDCNLRFLPVSGKKYSLQRMDLLSDHGFT